MEFDFDIDKNLNFGGGIVPEDPSRPKIIIMSHEEFNQKFDENRNVGILITDNKQIVYILT